MTARTEAERVAVLETQMENLKRDFENVADLHRKDKEELETHITELEKKLNRYEWIMAGITTTIGIFAATLQWILSVFGVSLSDISKK